MDKVKSFLKKVEITWSNEILSTGGQTDGQDETSVAPFELKGCRGGGGAYN